MKHRKDALKIEMTLELTETRTKPPTETPLKSGLTHKQLWWTEGPLRREYDFCEKMKNKGLLPV